MVYIVLEDISTEGLVHMQS